MPSSITSEGIPIGEPIAVIGIGCRFPGGVNNLQTFWKLLENAVDAITEIPVDRVDVAPYFDPVPASPGKIVSREGGFLENVDLFDASFFGISPREANYIDPQQRLLLEVAWEALEDAGQIPNELKTSRTGIFIGMWTNDYADKMYRISDDINLYTTTGGGRYAASGRLSYFFGFQGPSLTVDTACSSSLVSIHLASQSLRLGESNMALAGGVNLILEPSVSIGYSRSKMLSPDGRCKFGDATANGYVRSEGVGLVVLKRLSDAIADKDHIHAVIRGSAVNNDGRSSDLLVAPGLQSQIKMLREAYVNAGVAPAEVGYVEAHGTGTQVGDPVELRAIGTVLAEGRPADQPCRIGSVKTNIGHTEAASGVAGLIKAILCLQHKQIPPSLHFDVPNPNIPWVELPLRMQTRLSPWPKSKHLAIAAVNSFGITGTNAHIVLSEWPEAEPQGAENSPNQDHLLTLSAHLPDALVDLAKSYMGFLVDDGAPALSDICYTAGCRRTHHTERLAVTGKSPQELAETLSAFIDQYAIDGITRERPGIDERAKVVFVFPGQGAQWLGMGRELLKQNQVFFEVLEQCEQAIQPWTDWSLLEQLDLSEESDAYRLNDISVIQPTLFAIEVALAAVWQSWGIEPAAVIGHSMGEVAAAYVAGALNLVDAARIICKRSQLMQRTSGQGAMAVVGLSFAEAEGALKDYEDKLSIAVHNSPRSVVLSGEPKALDAVLGELRMKEIFCRSIKVDVASHSPQMDPLRPELVASLDGIQPQKTTIPFYSTATEEISDGFRLDPEYWGKNLRQPVQFGNMIQELLETDHSVFIEMSPHPILLTSIQEVSSAADKPAYGFASLRRDQPEVPTMLGELGSLYCLGYQIDWETFYSSGGQIVSLPNYSWQRERFWLEEEELQFNVKSISSDRDHSRQLIRTQYRDSNGSKQNTLLEFSDWLYEVEWKHVTHLESGISQKDNVGPWLIFADQAGISTEVVKLLGSRNEQFVLVTPGKSFTKVDNHSFSIDPKQPDDMQKLLDTTLSGNNRPFRGIIHLWSLDTPPTKELTSESLERAQLRNCGSILHLVQKLSQIEMDKRPRIWLVTQGAQPVLLAEETSLSIGQAPLWGFGRVLAEEHPEFWGGLIDIDPKGNKVENAALLYQEIHSSEMEDQLAYRNNQRFAARLVRKDKPNEADKPVASQWRTDGTYLITGGLGGIGIQIARWMVEQGARRLILMGRTQLPPRAEWNLVSPRSSLGQKIAAIKEIESLGASVHLAACDVSNENNLKTFLDEFEREGWPRIRGVVHLAGFADDHSLLEMDINTLRKVLRPKVLGGWHLHRLLGETDVFILFSSLNSILVQPGQSNYAAANMFLDALAYYRYGQKQSALCVNWAIWDGLGLVNTPTGKRNTTRMSEQGINSFTSRQGLEVLEGILQENRTQVIVAPIDWSKLYRSRTTKRPLPLIANLLEKPSQTRMESSASIEIRTEESLYKSLVESDVDQRKGHLERHLQTVIARILRLSPSRITFDKPLGDFGLDSLMAVELRNRLEADLGLKLSATLVWNYPTINQLSSYLMSKLQFSSAENESKTETIFPQEAELKKSKTDDILADVNTLSDEEAMLALLNGKKTSL